MSVRVCPVASWLTLAGPAMVARRGAQVLTRTQWQRQIVALGQRLLARTETRWALCFDDSYLFSVALLAVLHAGKCPVIPGHARPSLLQEQAAEFDGVLCDVPLSLSCPVWSVQDLTESEGSDTAEPLPPIMPDACVVLFTSGSTGEPQKIIRPVSCLDEEARWLAGLWDDRMQDCTFIASVSHQHLYGLTFRIILPLALGLPFDSRQIAFSEELAALARDVRYVFISSPAFLRRLDVTLPAPDCPLVVSAGGVLPWPSAQDAADWFQQPVAEIYGSTETGVLASRTRASAESMWQPFSGVTFSAESQQRWRVFSPLIPQAEGLLLDDKLVFSGPYFQLGERHDRTVKIEDKRVSLSDIERRLRAFPQVKDVVALAVNRPGRNAIGVLLVLDRDYDDAALSEMKRQWRNRLRCWLEPVAIPRYWRITDVIPQNSQSKRAWPQIQELFDVTR